MQAARAEEEISPLLPDELRAEIQEARLREALGHGSAQAANEANALLPDLPFNQGVAAWNDCMSGGPEAELSGQDEGAELQAAEASSARPAEDLPQQTPRLRERPKLEPRALPDARQLAERVFCSEGMIFAGALTAPLLFSAFPGIGFLFAVIHFVGVTSEMFHIVGHMGHHRLGLPMLFAEFGPGAGPFARMFQGLVLIIPLVATLSYSAEAVVAPRGQLDLGAALAWLLGALVYACLTPALVLSMVRSGSLLTMLNPVSWARIIHGIPRNYFHYVLRAAPLFVLGLALRIDDLWSFFDFMIIDGLLRSFASVVSWMFASLWVGVLLLAEAEFFGQSLDCPVLDAQDAAEVG